MDGKCCVMLVAFLGAMQEHALTTRPISLTDSFYASLMESDSEVFDGPS